MRSDFNLFSNHLELAHLLWQKTIGPGDTACDMTCGNGHDLAFLLSLSPKKIYAVDIQQEAIEQSKKRTLGQTNIDYFLMDHSDFPSQLEDESIKLIVYNLGYLPGGDKTIVTSPENTLRSVSECLPKIRMGGAISITLYPGHPEGKVEEDLLLEFANSLPPFEWMATHHSWKNRRNSPSLLWLSRKK